VRLSIGHWPLAVAAAIVTVTIAAWIRLGPLPPIPRDTSPVITDHHGVVLYEPLASNGTRSEWISDVPENVARATIAAEDRRFERHVGVDPMAVARAVLHDVRHLHVVEGGSTITQQVAKMMLANQPRTFAQKLREAIVALRLEHRYSKREILALSRVEAIGEWPLRYVNRLSDAFFVLGRWVGKHMDEPEYYWERGLSAHARPRRAK